MLSATYLKPEKETLFKTQYLYYENTDESTTIIISDESLQFINYLALVRTKFNDEKLDRKDGNSAHYFFHILIIEVSTKFIVWRLGLIVVSQDLT